LQRELSAGQEAIVAAIEDVVAERVAAAVVE